MTRENVESGSLFYKFQSNIKVNPRHTKQAKFQPHMCVLLHVCVRVGVCVCKLDLYCSSLTGWKVPQTLSQVPSLRVCVMVWVADQQPIIY